MLNFILVSSGVLLLIVNLLARLQSKSLKPFLIIVPIIALGLSLFMSMLFSPKPLILQAAFLLVIGSLWLWREWKFSSFLGLSCLATFAAYAAYVPSYLDHQNTVVELRHKYPLESLDDRLGNLRLPDSGNEFDANSVGEIESEISNGLGAWHSRNQHLKDLHENNVQLFIHTEGLGEGRMRNWSPRNHGFENGLHREESPLLPQLSTYSGSATSFVTPNKLELGKLHRNGLLDFLNPSGFGYVKDRQHVAGFQSHQFSKMPSIDEPYESKKAAGWEVARLELVSLLMHKEPSVYLSDRLPQMDALKGVPTRPLDSFETDGLAALRKGEDLYLRGDRMLGSIRSTKQCLACHGGDRGMLLGAFTYTLRPAAK